MSPEGKNKKDSDRFESFAPALKVRTRWAKHMGQPMGSNLKAKIAPGPSRSGCEGFVSTAYKGSFTIPTTILRRCAQPGIGGKPPLSLTV